MANMQISVIIPCLNEARTIERSIRFAEEGIGATGLIGEVLIADNGSSDGSVEIAGSCGARVIHSSIRGYGATLHEGIMASYAGIVAFADADLSYDFRELKKIVTPIVNGKADLVLGSRFNTTMEPGAMSWINRCFGTPFLSFLIRLLFGLKTTDCNSGMRAISRECYLKLKMESHGMEYASEMLAKAGLLSLRYMDIPITFHKDERGRSSHLRRWRDGFKHLGVILKLRIVSLA